MSATQLLREWLDGCTLSAVHIAYERAQGYDPYTGDRLNAQKSYLVKAVIGRGHGLVVGGSFESWEKAELDLLDKLVQSPDLRGKGDWFERAAQLAIKEGA